MCIYIYLNTNMHIYIYMCACVYMYIYIYLCVCESCTITATVNHAKPPLLTGPAQTLNDYAGESTHATACCVAASECLTKTRCC